MKILIVEDDQNKLQHLSNHIKESYPQAEITGKKSYHSGLKEVLNNKYNLVILDMSMPTYDITPSEPGGRPRVFAGREVLLQMRRKGIETPIIVVTQFETFGDGEDRMSIDELRRQLKKLEGDRYIDTIYYSSALNGWKRELNTSIDKVITRAKGKGISNAENINP